MDLFFRASAAVLLALILSLAIRKQSAEIAAVLSVFVCCLLACIALSFLSPVLEFMDKLQRLGSLQPEYLHILLRVVGIAYTAEMASLVCNDTGNAAMGKALQILSSVVIVYLSLPILNRLMELVETILGNL